MGFQLSSEEEDKVKKSSEDVGFFESALAGVATGLINIPKGFVSLGAEVFDLLGDTNTASAVEKFFDDLNPFDDEAEARTIGRITQAITSIGPLAIKGAQVGVRAAALAKKALDAKKTGKYLSLAKVGSKIMGPTTGAVVGAGVGEAIVADEDIGTFADITKGTSLEPFAITMMDRETKEGRSEAFRRLKNRLKFGTEGALFNLAIIGAGKGIQQLRTPSETGLLEYAEGSLQRKLQKYGMFGLRPEGTGTKATLEARRFGIDNIRAVERAASNSVKDLDTAVKELGDVINNDYLKASKGYKESANAQEVFLKDLYDVLRPVDKGSDSLLIAGSKERVIGEVDDIIKFKNLDNRVLEVAEQSAKLSDDRAKNLITEQEFVKRNASLVKESQEIAKQLENLQVKRPDLQQLIKRTNKGFFNIKDYKNSAKFNNILDKVKAAGGDTQKLETAVLNFRRSVDNMSLNLLQKRMPAEVSDKIKDNLGVYLNAQYKQFELQGVLGKYKPTSQQIDTAIQTVKGDKIAAFQTKNKRPPTTQELNAIVKETTDEVNAFLKAKSIDEVELLNLKNQAGDVINNPTKAEIENIVVKDSILKNKILKPWQEELAGLVKDPSYSFYSTVSKQAHLNYTLKYMDDLVKSGSKGPNKFIFNADELSDVQKANPLQFKLVQPTKGLSALEGKYVRAPLYDAIFDTTSNWLNQSGVGTFYKYAVLLPKAGSQIAKTILSPLTHVRNLLSAAAFVSANGAFFPNYGDIKVLLPKALGGQGVFKQAYDLTGKRILGTMTKADDELYERILKVGVVDSAVQPGETKRLLKDILDNPEAAERQVFTTLNNNLPNKIRKFYGKAQDAYVAEDDFWKVINWNLERNRYSKISQQLGVTKDNYRKILAEDSRVGKYFRKLVQREEYASESFDNFLDEVAGSLTRNLVPNYAYVGRTARALRQSPFGNFIAFPLEILRTGNNIFTRSIDDITSGIPEIAGLGYKRLFSFGMTVGGVPFSLVQAYKAKNDVSNEEMSALRRMVPEWSKNSTLIPVGRDENGYLKYVDFSYANAYDTLVRPFTSVVAELSQGQANKDSLMKSLGTGMSDSLYELLEPFASESIYTEALLDATVRRGIGRDGRRVWQDADDGGVKLVKAVSHVAKSLSPGSIAQFKRIANAVQGEADKKYGQTFNLQDELPGLFGFRAIKADPEKAMVYKTTRFTSNLKKADNLFTSPLLRGGRVSPQDIISSYAYSEQRRFAVLKEMYQDIEAARNLGMSNSKIRKELKKRKGLKKDVTNDLLKGQYQVKEPSDFFINRIRKINNDLNAKEGVDLPNPYVIARPVLNKIRIENRKISLLEDSLKVPEFLIKEDQAVFPQEIQTPPVVTAPINPAITSQASPQTGSTLPPNFASLPTAERNRIIEEFFGT